MMKGRSTIVLLVAVMIMAAFIYFFEKDTESTSGQLEKALHAFNIDAADLSLMEVAGDNLNFSCFKDKSGWMFSVPAKDHADDGAVEELIHKLSGISRGETVTAAQMKSRGLSLDDYGLQDPEYRITLGNEEKHITYLLGGPTSLGSSIYVTTADGEDVYTADASILSVLPDNIAVLRSHNIFHEERSQVRQISLHREDGFLQLIRDDDGRWYIRQPVIGRADRVEIVEWLDRFFEYRIEEFITDNIGDAGAYGLVDSPWQMTLYFNGDENGKTFILGRRVADNPDLIYVKRKSRDSVYAVPAEIEEMLRIKIETLRDHRLLPVSAREIAGMHLMSGDKSVEFSKDTSGIWRIEGLEQIVADAGKIEDMIGAWTALEILEFRDNPGTNMEEMGFSPGRVSIAFSKYGEQPVDRCEVSVCSLEPEQGGMWIKVADEPALYRVAGDVPDNLSFDPLDYRTREVLALDRSSVRSIGLKRDEQEELLQYDQVNKEFVLSKPLAGTIDDLILQKLIVGISRLIAVRFEVAAPPSLEPFGLAEPAAELTIGVIGQEGISKTVRLGSETGDQQFYAMIQGQDVIFTLDKDTKALLFPGSLLTTEDSKGE